MSTRTFLSLRNLACASAASVVAVERGQAGVGAGEEVVVDLAGRPCRRSPWPRSRSRRCRSMWHSAQLRLGHRRIVEAPRPVAGDAREQERVVVVLAADEVLVVVQGEGDARPCGRSSRTWRSLIDRLQERLLVHLGLGLDQRVVDPLEDRVVAGGEGVMLGLLDRVGGVAPGVVDVGDRRGRPCR